MVLTFQKTVANVFRHVQPASPDLVRELFSLEVLESFREAGVLMRYSSDGNKIKDGYAVVLSPRCM